MPPYARCSTERSKGSTPFLTYEYVGALGSVHTLLINPSAINMSRATKEAAAERDAAGYEALKGAVVGAAKV